MIDASIASEPLSVVEVTVNVATPFTVVLTPRVAPTGVASSPMTASPPNNVGLAAPTVTVTPSESTLTSFSSLSCTVTSMESLPFAYIDCLSVVTSR